MSDLMSITDLSLDDLRASLTAAVIVARVVNPEPKAAAFAVSAFNSYI